MARVPIIKPDNVEDPEIQGIFAWVTEMEGSVPNHFYVERVLQSQAGCNQSAVGAG